MSTIASKINVVLPIVLSAVFLSSGTSKILYFGATHFAIRRLLGQTELSYILLTMIVAIELALGVFFLSPKFAKKAASLSAVLLIFFTFIVSWGKAAGIISHCPCFGRLFGSEIGPKLYLRNFALVAFSIFIVAFYNPNDRTKKFMINAINKINWFLFLLNLFLFGWLLGRWYA